MASKKKVTSKRDTRTVEEKIAAIVWPCGIEDAALYCRMTVANIKYHYHIAGDLKGRRVGHTLLFTQADLDSFLANKRAPGRPPLGYGDGMIDPDTGKRVFAIPV